MLAFYSSELILEGVELILERVYNVLLVVYFYFQLLIEHDNLILFVDEFKGIFSVSVHLFEDSIDFAEMFLGDLIFQLL